MPYQILNTIIEKTTERVPKQMQRALDGAVMAGLKIMHDGNSHDLMIEQIRKEGDMAENIGEGVAKLVGVILDDSKGKLPVQALIPAGIILCCKAAEFVADAGVYEVTNETISEVIQEFSSSFLQLLGVTPEKLDQLMAQAQGQQAGGAAPQEAAPQQQAGGIIASAQE